MLIASYGGRVARAQTQADTIRVSTTQSRTDLIFMGDEKKRWKMEYDDSGNLKVKPHFTCFASFTNHFQRKARSTCTIFLYAFLLLLLFPSLMLALHNMQQFMQIFDDNRERLILQPHYNYMRKMCLPHGNAQTPADGICTHYLKKGESHARIL